VKTALIIAGMILVGVIGVGTWWTVQLQPLIPKSTNEVTVVVPKSQAAVLTLSELENKKIIKSALAARIYLRAKGWSQKMQNGTFVVSPGQTLPQVLSILMQAPKDVWITIPEGWRREQIAERFANELTGSGFVASEFLAQTINLEGRLFPDTYLVPRYATAADIVKIMTITFAKRVPEISKETLTLASLVEREGKTSEDRPIIAGILTNRLNADWPLQVDATVQFAKGNWEPISNTKFPSIYNTYQHLGLPPSPICSPGLAAINAALNPSKTNYFYYLHDNKGMAHYGVTLAEHNANIDKYLNH